MEENNKIDDNRNSPNLPKKCEEQKPKRFKIAVLSVMKRLKLLTKGSLDEEILPDPSLLPITSSCHLSVFALAAPNEITVSSDFKENFQDDIDLNMSLSKTGTCVLYRDKKTKHCVVRDISDERSCRGFFEWYSCYHIMPERAKIIILDLYLNIVQAFHSLLDNKTRAAPIWDSQNHRFIAMFTITDFIKILHKYYKIDKKVLDNIPENTLKDCRDMMGIINTKMIAVSPEQNLRYAASIIVKNNIHRLPVIDPINGNILTIITNSQLFQFFYERFLTKRNSIGINTNAYSRTPNIPIPSYFKEKICDLKIGNYNDAISIIHPWQTVYEAFDIFVKNHISVIPVVDENHRLVDIYARYDVIVSIAETGKYQNLDETISVSLKSRKKIRPPCTCSKEDYLSDVLEMIYKAQVHRIFVVDVHRHILGVISLTDILSFLCDIQVHGS